MNLRELEQHLANGGDVPDWVDDSARQEILRIRKHSMGHIPELWAKALAEGLQREALIREKFPEVFNDAHHVAPEPVKPEPKVLNQTRYDRKVDREPRNKDYKPSLLERIFRGKSSKNENDKRGNYNKSTG